MHDVGVAMSEAQIEAFLQEHATGVLAFAGTAPEEPPDSLPVPYGYDRRNDTVVLPLSRDEAAEDREDPAAVSFTVHDHEGGVRSVVLTGELRRLPAESLDRAARVFETTGPERRGEDGDPGPTGTDRGPTDPEWYTLAAVEKMGRQPAQAAPTRSVRP